MTLDQLANAEVQIPCRDEQKYIVAQVTDSSGASKLVVRTTVRWDHHLNSVESLKREAEGLHVKCLGGGMLHVLPKTKCIYIWSWSDEFGEEPNRETSTTQLLQVAYPEYTAYAKRPDMQALIDGL